MEPTLKKKVADQFDPLNFPIFFFNDPTAVSNQNDGQAKVVPNHHVELPQKKKHLVQASVLKGSYKPKDIRISDALNKKNTADHEEETVVEKQGPKTAFTETQLKAAIKEFVLILKQKRKHSVYPAIENAGISLGENARVELYCEHEAAREILKETTPELIGFLKDKLNNHSIVIKAFVDIKKTPKSKIPYTTQERYNALVEKNPTLEELKRKLKLDLN